MAADGADSAVRHTLGIGRSGRGLLSVQRSILFRAPLQDYLRHGVVQFEIEQPTLKAFLTTYGDGRWVVMLGDGLIRPDGYVAWRTLDAPDDPIATLTGALRGVAAA